MKFVNTTQSAIKLTTAGNRRTRSALLSAMVVMALAGTVPACGTDGTSVSTLDTSDVSTSQPEFSGSLQQFINVGEMLTSWGGLCTATLISENMVLTAAHCMYKDEHLPTADFDSDDYTLLFTDANGLTAAYDSARVHVMPNTDALSDIVIVELSSNVKITPMAIMNQVSNSALGNNVGLVGYGELKPNDPASVGIMHVSSTQLKGVSADQIAYGNAQTSTSCYGDSGGPVVHQRADGTFELAGVVHGGSLACTGESYATRADIYGTWIKSIVNGCGSTSTTVFPKENKHLVESAMA